MVSINKAPSPVIVEVQRFAIAFISIDRLGLYLADPNL